MNSPRTESSEVPNTCLLSELLEPTVPSEANEGDPCGTNRPPFCCVPAAPSAAPLPPPPPPPPLLPPPLLCNAVVRRVTRDRIRCSAACCGEAARSVLHMGQKVERRSHWSMHGEWNTWWHAGNSFTDSPASMSHKQMEQVTSFPFWAAAESLKSTLATLVLLASATATAAAAAVLAATLSRNKSVLAAASPPPPPPASALPPPPPNNPLASRQRLLSRPTSAKVRPPAPMDARLLSSSSSSSDLSLTR
mmetsp:Transcript_13288/g.26163  ORF Transcript_13288/g.26163 Transcript_13288/m.26163 type:complete len:249 (-) Transcript_13288:425-1171(-)